MLKQIRKKGTLNLLKYKNNVLLVDKTLYSWFLFNSNNASTPIETISVHNVVLIADVMQQQQSIYHLFAHFLHLSSTS